MSAARVRRLTGFDDPAFTPENWDALLGEGPSAVVFLTHAWQRTWWETFGRGELLLFVLEREGQPVAIAPFFADCGMAYLVASGGSDYLDFIGDTSDPTVLDSLLSAVRDATPGFIGFKLYHVPDDSPTGRRLCESGARLGMSCFEEGDLGAPSLQLAPGTVEAAASHASLLRNERALGRLGPVSVRHLNTADAILEFLPAFFSQHITRWSRTEYPSQFHADSERIFFERLTRAGSAAGWLRFTTISCDGALAACHFGMMYRRRFLCYKPTFDPNLARYSPGTVLLRQLFLAAGAEQATEFDFGLGEEPYKTRFASRTPRVRNWGLYRGDIGGLHEIPGAESA